MLSIYRESMRVHGSSAGEVVRVRRSGDATPRIADSERKLRVLVVDDNRDAADSLSMLVNLWGNDVRTAYDGATALEMTAARQAHVVLLDIGMPKMDGYEVARQLRQQAAFGDMLLIAVTGWTGQTTRVLCDGAGFDHYLIKPIDLDHLEILLGKRHWLAQQSAEDVEKGNEIGRERAGDL